MTDDDHSTTEPMAAIHRRLSVARLGASPGRELVAHLAIEGRSGVIDLTPTGATPITREELLGAATRLAAERAGAREAQLAGLEAELEAALQARDVVAAERDEAAARLAHLHEGIEWCDQVWASLPELRDAVDAAAADVDARRGDQRATEARLERVLEQRAEVAAATEEALRELQGLDGAHLDETGLRREVEAANSAAQSAAAAHAEATGRLGAIEARCAALAEEIDAVTEERTHLEAALAHVTTVTSGVRTALTAYEEALTFGQPDLRAADVGVLLAEIEGDLAALLATLPPGPDPSEVEAARDAMRSAQALFEEADATARAATLTPTERAAIDAAHEAVVQAEDAGLARAVARRRVEEARAAEQALLDAHGFTTYLDVVLSGGRPTEVSAARAIAERRAQVATQRFEAISEAAAPPPAVAKLTAERGRLLAEAAALLRVEPAGRAVELLTGLRTVPADVADRLVLELHAVGVHPAGIRLDAAAAAWLADQEEAAALHEDGEARLAELDRHRVELSQQLAAAEAELAEGAREVRRAAESEASARRAVAALEAELTARAGEDTRRLQRIAAAEQLRTQVEAVERTLQVAEDEARAAVDAAAGLVAAAESALTHAEGELTDVARRARRWVEVLPQDLTGGLGGDPLGGLDALTAGLVHLAERQAQAVAAAEEAVRRATAAADAASAVVADARLARDGAATVDDLADALAVLATDPARGAVAVLDEPLAGEPAAVRDRLLEVVLDVSGDRPVVLLTADPEILGWAIGLPQELGAIVPADLVLTADRGRKTRSRKRADHLPAPVAGRRGRDAG